MSNPYEHPQVQPEKPKIFKCPQCDGKWQNDKGRNL